MGETPVGYADTLMRRVDALRADLLVEVNKIKPQPGETIIIKPKSPMISFPAHYIQWIADSLTQVYPNNQIMILPDNQLEISTGG